MPIVKSLSRHGSSGSSGSLVRYVMRYAVNQKETQLLKLETKADLPTLNKLFSQGTFEIEHEFDADMSCLSFVAEEQRNAAIRLAKNTAIGKQYLKELKAQQIDHRGTKLYITQSHFIASTKRGDQFFRLSLPDIEKSPKSKASIKGKPFIIAHNLKARTLEGWIREFQMIESRRQHPRKNSPAVHHHILSFSNKDKDQISDALLRGVAEEFIRLRSPNSAFIGSKHEDKDHIHVHLAMSAVDIIGNNNRISKAEFRALKIELDRWVKDKHPEIAYSFPAHGKGSKNLETPSPDFYKNSRTNDYIPLRDAVEKAFASATSPEQFVTLLKLDGYDAYTRNGKLTGATVGERKFRFSKLGLSPAKMQELADRKEQEQDLKELQNLRSNSARDKGSSRLETINEMEKELTLEQDEVPSNDLETSEQSRDDEMPPSPDEEKSESKEDNDKEQESDERDSPDSDDRDR